MCKRRYLGRRKDKFSWTSGSKSALNFVLVRRKYRKRFLEVNVFRGVGVGVLDYYYY